MSTINELLEEVENKVNDFYKDKYRKEILRNIDLLINLLNGKDGGSIIAKQFQYYSADELTRMGGKLAIYQYNLIEYELEAFKNTKRSEIVLDLHRFNARKKIISENTGVKKPNETDIKIKTDSLMISYELEKSLHEAELNKITALKFSINTIIGRIESRIRYLLTIPNTKLANE